MKASKLSYFYPGVLARASVCLAFLVWRFFFGGGGASGVKQGWGDGCLPLGREEGFRKHCQSRLVPLRTVNHALCRSVSAQQPQLPTSAGNAIRHVPRALDHPGGMWGNTQKNKCACTCTITQTQHSRAHSDTHTYVWAGMLVLRMWGGSVCGIRGEGAKEFHNKPRFEWFLSLGSEYHRNSQLPLWQISKDWWPSEFKGLQTCPTLRENIPKLSKTNSGRNKSQRIVVWAKYSKQRQLKLDNKPSFGCFLFVGRMPEPTGQTKLLKDGEHFWDGCHVRLCFGFPNYIGFGKCKEEIRIKRSKLVWVAVAALGFSGIFTIKVCEFFHVKIRWKAKVFWLVGCLVSLRVLGRIMSLWHFKMLQKTINAPFKTF